MVRVYVILVALEPGAFEHYCKEPKTFYETYQEANEQLELLVRTEQFNRSQLKIQKLWMTTKNN
ncbi:hypothetical protein [Winogradskyella luteola]|uniref:Uncharacterized protein n=1 Tax=Winogradskyella luteola TaxID=2828330 RepID=A0A9X1FCU2_9FLAO|nr:hypothetical protein [Winogradskyella luteola]MBV7270648.1 hypothetical protein [Winogradskyella luteola]